MVGFPTSKILGDLTRNDRIVRIFVHDKTELPYWASVYQYWNLFGILKHSCCRVQVV